MGKPLIINKRVKISEKAQKKINKLSEYRENSIEFKLLTNIIFSIDARINNNSSSEND